MRIEVPVAAVAEANPKVLALVLSVERQPPLELDADRLAVMMLRKEVSALPVIAESDRDKAVIGKDTGKLLVVVAFLLACVQRGAVHFIEYPRLHGSIVPRNRRPRPVRVQGRRLRRECHLQDQARSPRFPSSAAVLDPYLRS